MLSSTAELTVEVSVKVKGLSMEYHSQQTSVPDVRQDTYLTDLCGLLSIFPKAGHTCLILCPFQGTPSTACSGYHCVPADSTLITVQSDSLIHGDLLL